MRTAARIARFSIVRSAAPSPAAVVVASRMKGVTAREPPERETGPAKRSLLGDGEPRVFRTRRREAAGDAEPRRNPDLVTADEGHQHARDGGHVSLRVPGIDRSASLSSVVSVSNVSINTRRLAIRIASSAGGAASRARRYASRSRRRARFLWTAVRIWRLTANPARRPCDVGRQSTTRLGRSIRLPCWKSA